MKWPSPNSWTVACTAKDSMKSLSVREREKSGRFVPSIAASDLAISMSSKADWKWGDWVSHAGIIGWVSRA